MNNDEIKRFDELFKNYETGNEKTRTSVTVIVRKLDSEARARGVPEIETPIVYLTKVLDLPYDGVTAAELLADIGTKESIGALIDYIETKQDSSLLQEISASLSRVKTKEAIPLLCDFIKTEPNAELSKGASSALKNMANTIAPEEATAALLEALSHTIRDETTHDYAFIVSDLQGITNERAASQMVKYLQPERKEEMRMRIYIAEALSTIEFSDKAFEGGRPQSWDVANSLLDILENSTIEDMVTGRIAQSVGKIVTNAGDPSLRGYVTERVNRWEKQEAGTPKHILTTYAGDIRDSMGDTAYIIQKTKSPSH